MHDTGVFTDFGIVSPANVKTVQKGLIVLRPATADDETFVNGLLFTTMHGYVEATWPDDPVARQHYYKINKCDLSNTRIIQLDDKDGSIAESMGRIGGSSRSRG